MNKRKECLIAVESCEGGLAAMAYGILQFEDLSSQDLKQLINELLRSCELNTFAAVMIAES